jgi:hypothetical protein
MEPEGSLPHSQVPATYPYPEPAQSSAYPHILLPEDPSLYYPPIYSWSPKRSLSLRFPHQNPAHVFLLPPYALILSTFEYLDARMLWSQSKLCKTLFFNSPFPFNTTKCDLRFDRHQMA